MPTKFIANNLLKAVKAVAPYVSASSNPPILKNALLFTQAGCLYVATTNLDAVAIARCGAKFEEETEPITVPAKLLAEVLATYESDSLVSLDVKLNTIALEVAGKVKIKTSLRVLDVDQFPKVAVPSEWPTDSDGEPLLVVVTKNTTPTHEASEKDWLYWRVQTCGGVLPAIGRRVTFSGVGGVFFGKQERLGWNLTEATTGLSFASVDMDKFPEWLLTPAYTEDIAKRAAVGDGFAPVPKPGFGNKLVKAINTAMVDHEALGVLKGLIRQLPMVQAVAVFRTVGRLARIRRAQEARAAIESAQAEAEYKVRQAQEAVAADLDCQLRRAFAIANGAAILGAFSPEKCKDKAKWVNENKLAKAALGGFTVADRQLGGFSKREASAANQMYHALDSAYHPDWYEIQNARLEEMRATAPETPAETAALTPEEVPAPAPLRNLYADLPTAMRNVMPNLEAYAAVALGVGNVVWVKAVDKAAELALAKAGFKFAPTLGAWHAKTERANELPVKATAQVPRSVAWRPYDRQPIQF